MPPRRKIHLPVVADPGEESVHFTAAEAGPTFSGEDDEDLLCGRCRRTLCLGLRRDHAADAVRSAMKFGPPRTAADRRPFPVVIQCDCGAVNRVWPVVPR